jgi:hypothetical protein
MHTDNLSAEEIGKHPAVARARRWRNRINIDIRGRPSFQHGMPVFKGESSARIRLQGTYLTIERGPGATSPEWEANLSALVSWLCSRGVRLQLRLQPYPTARDAVVKQVGSCPLHLAMHQFPDPETR